MILFTDTVLEEIDQAIAQKEPEQGGALLGAPDSNLISHFIYDEAARTTSVTYRPSKHLIQAVKEMEQADGLQFKGIIHSHPGSMDYPSAQDHHAFASQLSHNLHMGRFIAPIVTKLPVRKKKPPLKPHEVKIGNSWKLSCYQAVFRFDPETQDTQLSIDRSKIGVVHYEAAIRHVSHLIENEFEKVIELKSDLLAINGLLHVVRSLKTPSFYLQIFFPHNFPTVPPLGLISNYTGKKLGLAHSLKLRWGMADYEAEKLGEHLIPLIKKHLKEIDNDTAGSQSLKRHSIHKSEKPASNPQQSKETSVC